MMSPINQKLFGQYVRDALSHYHDPVRLQRHPLGKILPGQVPEASRVQALRAALLRALDLLRPEASIPYGDPAWWPYRALWMRYIEGREVNDICAELAVGRSSFYEHHRAGLEALVNLLWAQMVEENASLQQEMEEVTDNAAELVQREVAQLAQTVRAAPVALVSLLHDVLATVGPLAAKLNRRLALNCAPELPTLYTDAAILRQALVNILAEGLTRAKDEQLLLEATGDEAQVVLRLGVLQAMEDRAEEFRISRALLATCGGQLTLQAEPTGGFWVRLSLPQGQRPLILLVDNDLDTLNLYRRYLEPEGYSLRATASGEEARRVLAEVRPHLVLLDLLMPEEDGWKLLQELKISPATADIPVLVCSVLAQPQLALALGAADVLNKPIGRAALLKAIQAALSGKNSSPANK